MAEKKKIRIIAGPTASGKTAAALALAARQPIEIISADSRQVFKHLDIGTAKPTTEEKAVCPFHLIDLIEPGESYSAARFAREATASITDILSRDHIPIIAGGTGLYLKSLCEGMIKVPLDDGTIRKRLEAQMEIEGPEAMHERLTAIDPLEAKDLHPNNRMRVIRALEIYELTGKTRTELMAAQTYKKHEFDFEFHILTPDREQLYERINARVDLMMQQGWLDEVQKLIDRGMSDLIKKAGVIGYDELIDHLAGTQTLDEALDLIKQNTRRFAKRQTTWFKNQVSGKTYENVENLTSALQRM